MTSSTLEADGARSNYRALMGCAAKGGWLTEAQAQLAAWLREKRIDVDVTRDGVHETEIARLLVRHRTSGGASSLRAQLLEKTPTGIWSTDLLAHDKQGNGDWLTLNVTNDADRFVDVPRLARYLIQALPLTDGSIEFIDAPRVVGAAGLDELIDVLCDEERHGLVFVAGTSDDSRDVNSFVAQVGKWAREVYGLAQVVVLDPAATVLLSSEFGDAHALIPWTIRTYFPGVDPASVVDSRRHRFLGAQRLDEMPERAVCRLLGEIARGQASSRPIAHEVLRVRRAFDRLENHALLAAIETEALPQVSPQTSSRDVGAKASLAAGDESLRQIELVKSILGLRDLNEVSLQRVVDLALAPRGEPESVLLRAGKTIDELQQRVEQLEDKLRLAEDILDEDLLERAELQQEVERSQAEVRWLRNRSQEAGDHESAFGAVPQEWITEYPTSFEELLLRLGEGIGTVDFTGDRRTARSVDANDTLQVAVRNAWDVCLALNDYVRARAEGTCERDVDHYLKHTPSGCRGVSPRKHAATETAQTMQQFGDKRVFPVPRAVSENAKTVMTAHFKLAQIGMVSPRLYYFDDVLRSGKVYIGYIGPHLPNTQTN